ncbi:hypothetical protein [Erythrobacter aureus]|uniref:Uncharacterized protein n=1 Tax=Erythrobacter aureus TaxID=2182384 RepID=A0A345YIW5_9SPHN|nr:hypothetical protein [Erythrobacter aureus]AXK43867.1 hypothetical protein DVR09_15545 [Erythrobacter aureus]
MYIHIELHRFLVDTPPAIGIDLAQVDEAKVIPGLKKLAEHQFGDCYAAHGEPRDAASASIEKFFAELGGNPRDLLTSYPSYEDAGDGFRLVIETMTPETTKRQSALIEEMLSEAA